MRRLSCLLLGASLVLAGEARILSHDIELRLDPEARRFESTDRSRAVGPGRDATPSVREVVVRLEGTLQAADAAPSGALLVRGFFAPGADPCTFRVRILVPLPYHAVAPGRRTEESEHDGLRDTVYESAIPRDGMTVLAGRWQVREETIGGVPCRAYFDAGNEGLAKGVLGELAEAMPRCVALFGTDVPDGRFDVVVGSFADAHGIPNLCLVDPASPRTPEHDLVHAWLGNAVLATGNWCEALATYLADYGAAIRGGAGAAYRARAARSFSLRGSGPGRQSMLFDMLARRLGEETLRSAIRHLVATRAGRVLAWGDVVEALSETAGADLAPWFEPWLSRTGAPILEFGEVRHDGARIAGTIRQSQDGSPYALQVPVRVVTQEGSFDSIVATASRESVFSIRTALPALRIEIDPDHVVFRALPRERVAPCLDAVLTAPRRVGFGDPALLDRLAIEKIEPALPKDAAVLAVGLPADLRDALVAGARRQEPTLRVGDGFFEVRGARYDAPSDALLLTFARPEAPLHPVTLFRGNGDAAHPVVPDLAAYAEDGWVVFREGRSVARGDFEEDRASRAQLTRAREGEPESLVRMLLLLTDPAHAGRRAGSTPSYLLANRLRGECFRRGLKMVAWPPVLVPLATCRGERTLLLGDKPLVGAAFYPFHRTSPLSGTARFARVVGADVADVKGALVLLGEGSSFEDARACAEGGAAVVAVVSADDRFTARGEEAAWEGAMPPSVAARVEARGGDASLAVAGMVARSAGRPLPCAYVYVSPETAEALRAGAGAGSISFHASRSESSTSNIVGILGEGREPGVLLCAHWDGIGSVGGKVAEAASDNAAGVAVVLWVAEQLRKDFEAGRLRRPVVVALLGGGAAGLLGSRQLAKAFPAPGCPIGRPAFALNVAGVGGAGGPELVLIGGGRHPELRRAFEASIPGADLAVAPEPSPEAVGEVFDDGPLSEAGIPAITICDAGFRGRDAAGDTLDRVDVARLRRIAAAVYRTVRRLAAE